ncbi:uncharacterized protein LOC112325235 [Populus trichocarpa]|uniref:uncharacterized protein LOC112325235 n=1 Tax=Populus trichocarpa TaxID=3694 RepID=UPI000D189472|nr:uncharacterized protein LOC112325235 [Populus trichocarpa]|eukprot:XP_024446955.1 uncharacterized protein LOC112325235 [Populus trichocarpa]
MLMINFILEVLGCWRKLPRIFKSIYSKKLGIEETEASQMNGVLYKSYGTSMAALKAIGYDFDSDDYHRFVHGRLPFERLKPDHVLRSLLLRLPSNLIQVDNQLQIKLS